jgi:mRNA interferase HigB
MNLAIIRSPIQMKKMFPTCRPITDRRVIFNILGNKYRMIVEVNYRKQLLWIKFIGTHSQYDKISVNSITI